VLLIPQIRKKKVYASYLYDEPEGVAERAAGNEQRAKEHAVVVSDGRDCADRLQVRFQ
jgi:hypothetical protein